MTRFNTVEDVKKAFLEASGGSEVLEHSAARLSDIEKHAHIVERLLKSDYNRKSGFSFTELCEALSLIGTNYNSKEYFTQIQNDSRSLKVSESMVTGESDYTETVSEAFEGTNISQAPFPVPSVALTTYQYERAVLPFLVHQFDLKGNRGYAYYQKITAVNAKGNINAGDLLGSPKEISAQPRGFIGTKIHAEELAELATGETHYTATLANVPMPGTMVITIEGEDGFFQDFASADTRDGEVALASVNGNLGTCVVKYTTKEVTIDLAQAPTTPGLKIKAAYDRDVQRVADAGQIAKVEIALDAKQLIAEDFSVLTETNVQQEALSRAIFGLDWNQEVDDCLDRLYNKEIANKVITELKDALVPTAIKTHDISAHIANGGNNALFNVQFISVVLGKLKQLIAENSGCKMNKVSAIVIATDVLPIIEALKDFEPATEDEENMGGACLVGLYRGIPVIMAYDDVMTSGEVLAIYKSKKRPFLAPYVFGTFISPFLRQVYDNNNLSVNRKQLISSAAGEVVAERLAAKMTINGIDAIL